MLKYCSVREAALKYAPDMAAFLRDLIRIPGEGQHEGGVIRRIYEEMIRLGFDDAVIDDMGNVLGTMGSGDRLIAFDGHADTVGTGSLENWSFDPYEGFEDGIFIGGRGASDQLGGIVSAVYGAKIAKELSFVPDDCRILVTGSVQEEECEGLSWQHIIESGIRPEMVVLTEPTDGRVCRGHRGRADIIVETKGISAHGSTPEKGSNAITQMAEIICELEKLGGSLQEDEFLGKGTLAVTQIFYGSPSRCAIPDYCAVSIDRRLTAGETVDTAIGEILALPGIRKYNAGVRLDRYERESWMGVAKSTDCYFPAWKIPEEDPACRALESAAAAVGVKPETGRWDFSTNGVSICGIHHIPCIGYGPGTEGEAHAPDEKIRKADLARCAAVYALVPEFYMEHV